MIVRNNAMRQGRRALRIQQLHTSQSRRAGEADSLEVLNNTAVDEIHVLDGLINDMSAEPIIPLTANEKLKQQSSRRVHEYKTFQKQKLQRDMHDGTKRREQYRPFTFENTAVHPKDITLELLLASQAHMGHATSLWNPANARYIEGIRQGIHIISLEATAAHLRRAAKVVSAVTQRAGVVLFVGSRNGQQHAVVSAAERAGGCHLFERWIPGSITNGLQILGRCRLKMVDERDNEVKGFEDDLRDLPPMKPDLVVCLNPMENWVMLHECALHNIPTIGVIDTNADPTWVTYPIPANDDSLRCIQLISSVLGAAGSEGRETRLRTSKNPSIRTQDRLKWQTAQKVLKLRKEDEEDGAKKSEILEALKEEKERRTILCGPTPAAIAAMAATLKAQRERLRMASGASAQVVVAGGVEGDGNPRMQMDERQMQDADRGSEDYDRSGRSRVKG